MSNILVTGTIAFDHLFTYDATFLEGLKHAIDQDVLSVSFQPHRYVKRHGGTGANISWNIALLGGSCRLVANIGPDGEEYRAMLQERGIDTRYITVKKSSMTATGVCCTDTREHQIWFFYRGADAVGTWPQTGKIASDIKYAIIGARHRPLMLEGLDWCKQQNIPCIFDPGQEILKFEQAELERAIDSANAIIVNEYEWSLIQERLRIDPKTLSQQLDYLIVTKGEKGYTIFENQQETPFPRCNCEKVVNPTGAGDAFRAGLLVGLTNGWNLHQASKLGAAVASFIVEQEGTLLDMLDMDLLQRRVREAYGEDLPNLPTSKSVNP